MSKQSKLKCTVCGSNNVFHYTTMYYNNHTGCLEGYKRDVAEEFYRCSNGCVFKVVSSCDGTDLDNHPVWEVKGRDVGLYRLYRYRV